MNLSSILKSISSTLSKPFSDNKYKNITVESIQAQLEDVKWALTNADASLRLLSEKQFEAAYTKMMAKIHSEPGITKSLGHPAADFITGLHKHLEGKSRSMGFYKAMVSTSATFSSILDELQTNLPTLMLNRDGIIINDIQISHVVLLGTIESIRVYSMMTGYIISIISHVLAASKHDHYAGCPKYVSEYVVKNGSKYIECINDMCNNPNGSITNQVTDVRKKGLDFRIAAEQDGVGAEVGIGTFLKSRTLSQWLVALGIAAFATGIYHIPLIGEVYVEKRHEFYEAEKQRKKWLEAHVANIKLGLEGMNENDPEYIRMQKVVAFYDDTLAQLDKTLQKYYDN